MKKIIINKVWVPRSGLLITPSAIFIPGIGDGCRCSERIDPRIKEALAVLHLAGISTRMLEMISKQTVSLLNFSINFGSIGVFAIFFLRICSSRSRQSPPVISIYDSLFYPAECSPRFSPSITSYERKTDLRPFFLPRACPAENLSREPFLLSSKPLSSQASSIQNLTPLVACQRCNMKISD